jgi:hypothetical protein
VANPSSTEPHKRTQTRPHRAFDAQGRPTAAPSPPPATHACRPLKRPRHIGHRCKRPFANTLLICKMGIVGGPHRRDAAQSPKNRRLRPSDRLRPGLDRRSRHQSAAQRAARHPLVVVWLDRPARSVSHSTRYADSAQPEMPLNWTVSWPGWTHDCLPSCVFRRIPAGNSDGSQPPIPRHSSHP